MAIPFWMQTGVALATASVMGLGLGAYVTSPQNGPRVDSEQMEVSPPDSSLSVSTGPASDQGPGEIRCKGCGPTLADRQRMVDMAGLDADGMIDGTRDPVAADYIAQEDAPSPVVDAVPPPVTPRLPASVGPLAADDTPPPVVQTTTAAVEPTAAVSVP